MSKTVMPNLISIDLPYACSPKRKLKFSCEEKTVKLPLKVYGKLDHVGWEIPTWWAVDADGQVWMDNAHGHPLFPVTAESLLSNTERQTDRNSIKKLLGLPEEQPEWMEQAIAAGWGPKTAEAKTEVASTGLFTRRG